MDNTNTQEHAKLERQVIDAAKDFAADPCEENRAYLTEQALRLMRLELELHQQQKAGQ